MRLLVICGAALIASASAWADAALPADRDYCYWIWYGDKAAKDSHLLCAKIDLMVLDYLPPDWEAADLEPRANAGDAHAMLTFANLYLMGKNLDAGLQWLRKAADANDPTAQAEMGDLYEHGVLVEQDVAAAQRWYRAGAQNGSTAAMFGLAHMSLKGDGVPQDEVEATRWYQKAAEAGNPAAMVMMGQRNRNGKGTPKNATEAVRWLKLAYAGGGRLAAAKELGPIYDKGDGVPPDAKAAAHWYLIAAELNDKNAKAALAQMYRQGRGVEKDAEQADYWAGIPPKLPSAQHDDYCEWLTPANPTPAHPNIFVCFTSDMRPQLAMRANAADPSVETKANAGDVRAMLLFGHSFLVKGDGPAGLSWIQKAADAGEPDAVLEIASFYERGVLLPADPAKALEMYRTAATHGSSIAKSHLGIMYASGTGVAKDDAEATRWYAAAAAAGNPAAMQTAGVRYLNGDGVPKNSVEALRLLKLAHAAGQRSTPASLIAKTYDQGDGVPANPALAYHWYRLAAQSGSPDACNTLAQMYRDGRGVAQDTEQADYWNQQALAHAPPTRKR